MSIKLPSKVNPLSLDINIIYLIHGTAKENVYILTMFTSSDISYKSATSNNEQHIIRIKCRKKKTSFFTMISVSLRQKKTIPFQNIYQERNQFCSSRTYAYLTPKKMFFRIFFAVPQNSFCAVVVLHIFYFVFHFAIFHIYAHASQQRTCEQKLVDGEK